MNLNDFVRRADEIIDLGYDALDKSSRTSSGVSVVPPWRFTAFRTAGLSFLVNVFGSEHPYYREFNTTVVESTPYLVELGQSILKTARDEMAGGWVRSARGLVSAEIFSDFLEMAEHLLSQQYKDAAAVIAGSALEGHLRQLAAGGNLVEDETGQAGKPVKADTLNAMLAKAGVYSKLDQKTVTAWLGLRNSAAHGNYSDYDANQVSLMIDGVRQFMARTQE